MFNSDALRETHRRCHESLIKLIEYCNQFSNEQINQEINGFGYPTIRLQLHHLISAQKYWIGVLEGRIDADEDDPDYPTIESLSKYREQIFQLTDNYLRNATESELNNSRLMKTWGDNERELTPVHVFLRTQTHIYHHMGQITAMCRLLGHPVPPGMDYRHA